MGKDQPKRTLAKSKKASPAVEPVAPKPELMTRAEVADLVGVSISTVRRWEGSQLQPVRDDRGRHLFHAEQVLALAKAMVKSSGSGQRHDGISAGELAAECFERFAQRQSLHEIVTALRVEPRKVRRLYREWLTGLELGEVGSGIPSERDYYDPIREGALERRLAKLPEDEPVRISVAIGIPQEKLPTSGKHLEVFDELGGFEVTGPIDTSEIRNRFGSGQVRVSAYLLTERRMLWEVTVML